MEKNDVISIMGIRDFKKLRTEKHFDKLYEYYSNSGEMPYGTMKARTEDPSDWIYKRVGCLLPV